LINLIIVLFLSVAFGTLANADIQEKQKFTIESLSSNIQFGFSSAIDGDTAVIGAFNKNSRGAAYIYERNTETNLFEKRATLTASDGDIEDRLGFSVAISNHIVVVGAPQADCSEIVNDDCGAVYIFEKPSSGGWIDTTQTAKFMAPDGKADDQYGYSVAISGFQVIVGAPYVDYDVTIQDSGAVYAYDQTQVGISYIETITVHHESAYLVLCNAFTFNLKNSISRYPYALF